MKALLFHRISNSIKVTHYKDLSLLSYPFSSLTNDDVLVLVGDINIGGARLKNIQYNIDFSRVILYGNIYCSNIKNPVPLPRFIKGSGFIDYTGNSITDNIIFPMGTRTLVLSYSITDLTQIIGKIPPSLSKIILDKKLLKSLVNLESTKTFLELYPEVTIQDKNCTMILKDLIVQAQPKQQESTQPIISQKEQKEPDNISIKDDENDLDRADLLCICKTKECFSDIDDETLKRKIQLATKTINTYYKKRLDGQQVICISKQDLDTTLQNLKNLIEDDTTNKTPCKPQKVQTEKQKKQLDIITSSPKEEPIIIKKYISKKLWDTIKKACHKNHEEEKATLVNIARINLPSIGQEDGPVPYIDSNGQKTCSGSVCKHGYSCISQTLGTKTRFSAARIIWAISPDSKTFIAVDFVSSHDKSKNRCKHNQIIDYVQKGLWPNSNTPIDFESAKTDSDMIDIDDLFDDGGDNNSNSQQNTPTSGSVPQKPKQYTKSTTKNTQKTNVCDNQTSIEKYILDKLEQFHFIDNKNDTTEHIDADEHKPNIDITKYLNTPKYIHDTIDRYKKFLLTQKSLSKTR